jgi:glucokinase
VPSDLVIGVDVGGTKMLAGLVARDGAVGRTVEVATPTTGQQQFLTELDALLDGFAADGAAIGVGVPMNLDRKTGLGLGAVNLPLRALDLAGHLRERFQVPVGVENDGNAIALAEWRAGAGRGTNDLVALALGTGVGGGVVLDGKLYRGWAELGHVVVDADGPPCQGNCHGRGHLEAVASGEAAERAAVELWGLASTPTASCTRRSTATPRRGARSSGSATTSARDRLFREHLRSRGRGRRRRVRDGGWELLREPALAAARREALQPADEQLRVVQAELGDDAGLVGAGLVGFEALDGER